MLRRLVPANPCRLLRDAEVFDSASGLTRVAWPPSPIIPSEPLYPPGPMFGLVNGQTARFTVVSLLPAGSRQAPVQLELSFVGADGATLLNGDGQPLVSRVALAPAASASLDVVYPPGPITPQRLNLRPVLKRFLPGGPTTPLVATTEVFDSVSGVTAFVVPPTRSTDDADD